MVQKDAWEREYRNPQLVSKKPGPRKDILTYLKFLRKEESVSLKGFDILDLGSGTGRNANYLAGEECNVTGMDLSETAITLAKERATALGVSVDYRLSSIGELFPFPDTSFDLILDIMTSNSLSEEERNVYMGETCRTLKAGGYFFVRALCKDGDKNAKNLLRDHPGGERDTYINTDMDLVERVFAERDFRAMYGKNFEITKLFKKTNYARFNGRPYKRNYWLAYLKKKDR